MRSVQGRGRRDDDAVAAGAATAACLRCRRPNAVARKTRLRTLAHTKAMVCEEGFLSFFGAAAYVRWLAKKRRGGAQSASGVLRPPPLLGQDRLNFECQSRVIA